MNKIIIKVKYQIETEYEFDKDELPKYYDKTAPVLEWCKNWIQEDFNRLETRADNVLPPYTSKLTIPNYYYIS